SPEWRATVAKAFPNSVANLLYSNFKPLLSGTNPISLNDYTGGDFTGYLCPTDSSPAAAALAAKFQTLLGVTAQDVTTATGTCKLTPQAGFADRNAPFQLDSVAIFGSQTGSLGNGNLFNGNEGSFRLDYTPGSKDRLFAQYNYYRQT